MSILRQTYTIEKYNRTETVCYNIVELIQKDPRMFRLDYGTHFNFRPVPKDRYGNRVDRWKLAESAFMVEVPSCRQYTAPCVKYGSFREASVYMHTTTMLADCKYIIRDGFGRAIHPDVLYKAFVEKYGEKATEFRIVNYHRHGPRPVRYDGKCWYQRYNGLRSRCWVGERSDYKFKKLLTQYEESFSKANTIPDELVESEYELVEVPPMRQGSIDGTYDGIYWDSPRRTTHKSWKSQSNARKQWAKNQK